MLLSSVSVSTVFLLDFLPMVLTIMGLCSIALLGHFSQVFLFQLLLLFLLVTLLPFLSLFLFIFLVWVYVKFCFISLSISVCLSVFVSVSILVSILASINVFYFYFRFFLVFLSLFILCTSFILSGNRACKIPEISCRSQQLNQSCSIQRNTCIKITNKSEAIK